MITRNIKLGTNELKLLFTLEEENKSVFSINDAKRILSTSTPSVWNVIYRLKKKGRIEEIEKGKYLLIPARAGYEGSWSEVPYLLVPHIIDVYYIGFWSALNYWGMTEQVPRVVFVAATQRKRDLDYGATRFEFVTLKKKRFFGYVEEKTARGTFNISSREKTIIDCMLYPKYCGGMDEAIKGIWNARDELDFVKLLEYSKRLGVSVVTRRVCYALELLGLAEEICSEIALSRLKGYMWLDPLGPKRALEYSKKYKLIINRTRDELMGWMRY
ncbi:putative transcriptional regulator [Candidatus Methanoperedens nitroreducens]|uniref:Putative transcriptional regulator n=1 Tax=Candidatus Methanoperedens nitratireducens TaxID=1392998 RepID=A0A062V4V2_9EURY|nr:type IV toxin-antitoxin system AbiEi family antitoxin [Candidatus Methanoperedens nitroreducens]KCZ72352.1 putative transcriptional regulator [Candidatus Methanoperedens nitroreducens]MDJ1423714.1 type IV toxin-antitoxin system AbiEi family antitoxin [Candidatus Methanoperedens sp.]